ncbi:MAG: dNTP triphosphohydrolase [Alphaproteobacteria bacterium]|nr:dNTP triphosphohydrolase [Alphaproteobacteria bacterium]
MGQLNWQDLLSDRRRRASRTPRLHDALHIHPIRTRHESDHDRILFSTPVRRLADKTQVFPLERHDSVRNRLTHSHEVANLAHSIGRYLALEVLPDRLEGPMPEQWQRSVPAILSTVALAHDLGNPPFGHQGESAIRRWFTDHEDELRPMGEEARDSLVRRHGEDFVDQLLKSAEDVTDEIWEDFANFEGNAQTFRLVTRLQGIPEDCGLNLTMGTLAAMLKYTVRAYEAEGKATKNISKKKPGFFLSEEKIVEDVWKATGLKKGHRHPLTFIMEACDDIAYSILDAEDAVKKGLVSFHDVLAFLEGDGVADPIIRAVCKWSREEFQRLSNLDPALSPSALNEQSMIQFRVAAVSCMASAVITTWQTKLPDMMTYSYAGELLDDGEAAILVKQLKNFDKLHAYRARSVLEVELTGFNTIYGLMDMLWRGISERRRFEDPGSDRTSPFSAYAYHRISEDYRRHFEDKNSSLPIRYREMQLLSDMISGMTDSFAMSLFEELKSFEVGPSQARRR